MRCGWPAVAQAGGTAERVGKGTGALGCGMGACLDCREDTCLTTGKGLKQALTGSQNLAQPSRLWSVGVQDHRRPGILGLSPAPKHHAHVSKGMALKAAGEALPF